MRLDVISTGSRGNCYILRSERARLVLDAGVPYKAVLRQARGLQGIEGVLVTHEHMDHCSGVRDLLISGMNVYATPGTIRAMLEKGIVTEHNRLHRVKIGQAVYMPSWTVVPIQTQHDAEEPCGFLIRHDPTGEMALYATDTYYLSRTYPGVHYWIVECNYCDEIATQMVQEGKIEKSLRNRLLTSHMSLRRLKQTLEHNDLTQTRKIVLVHLSDDRSDEERMVNEIRALTGIETVAALNGGSIPLELTPF